MTGPTFALIGAGQIGSHHARVIAESTDADLSIVIDSNVDAAARLGELHGVKWSSHVDDAMHCDAVVVATTTAAHLACALPFVQDGKAVFIEKPLAPSLAEVDELIEAAEHRDVPLMCGFVERFNAAFRTAVSLLTDMPRHVLTVRHSPPAARIQSSVVSDLLLHDLDVVLQLFGYTTAQLIGAAGHRPDPSSFLEIVDCTLAFPAGGVASLSANRMGQRKVRDLTIHAGCELIEVDLLRQNVTVYRHVSQEMTHPAEGVGYRSSTEIEIPFVRQVGEPLQLQFAHFLDLVHGAGDRGLERSRVRPAHHLMDAVENWAFLAPNEL